MPWKGMHAWEKDHFNGFVSKLHRFPVPREAQCIVDVGANVGLFSAASLAYCPQAKVIAFEPSSAAFSVLSHRLQNHPRLCACQKAVGAKRGEATLAITEHLASSTMMSETQSAQKAFGNGARPTGKQEQVEVTTLDHELMRENSLMIDLLKVDVEGFEPEVLAGGMECLRHRVQRLIVEHSIARLGLDGVLALIETIQKLGFLLVDLNDVHRSRMDAVRSLSQFDAWFVHERLLRARAGQKKECL